MSAASGAGGPNPMNFGLEPLRPVLSQREGCKKHMATLACDPFGDLASPYYTNYYEYVPLPGLSWKPENTSIEFSPSITQIILSFIGKLGTIAMGSKSGRLTADRIAMALLKKYSSHKSLEPYVNLDEIRTFNMRGMIALRYFLEKMRAPIDSADIRKFIPLFRQTNQNGHPLAIFCKQINSLHETYDDCPTIPCATDLVKYLEIAQAANLCRIAPALADAIRIRPPSPPAYSAVITNDCSGVLEQAAEIRAWMTDHADQLQKATQLSLFSLGLTLLPPEVCTLTGLQTIFLSKNELTGLPAEIGKLVELRQLHLDSNLLTSLPAEMGNLPDLQWLSCKYNRFERPPSVVLALFARGAKVFVW